MDIFTFLFPNAQKKKPFYNKECVPMLRILMILAFCTHANILRADTGLTPWVFDLRTQFDACISTPSATPYRTCQNTLTTAYTLRREIAGALNVCQAINVKTCLTAFNNAGFPAEQLTIIRLKHCEMLGNLSDVEIIEIPENSCVELFARTIEENDLPTTHNADISCGRNYIECLEIIGMGMRYWENSLWSLHSDRLNAIPNAPDFANDSPTSHRYYSLLERQIRQQIDLAETTCHILTVTPHWANLRDYDGCMGAAYADMWSARQN